MPTSLGLKCLAMYFTRKCSKKKWKRWPVVESAIGCVFAELAAVPVRLDKQPGVENILMMTVAWFWTQQKKPAGNCVNQNCDGRGSFFDIVLSSSEVITVVFDYDDHPRNWLWADSLKYLFLFRYEIKSTCKWSYQVSLTKKDKWRCGKHCQGQSSRLLPRLWWGERWRNMKPKSLVK